jgi:small subunit ribosomal protein S5
MKNKIDENLKKTVEANESVSEEVDEHATEKMIQKEMEKEGKEKSKMKVKQIEKIEIAEEIKEKEVEKVIKKGYNRGPTKEEILMGWEPKTKLGKDVKAGKIKNIDEILEKDMKILEEQIVDTLLDIKTDLISIGQSKGKFGGGKRRAWRQTQRKTREGNAMTFSTMAVVGDEKEHVGIGVGKSTETLPARDKATRKAKLNVFKITKACSAFDCDCDEKHTVPFKVTGKEGSTSVTLIPAPQGTGLVVPGELKKVLKMAGIKDVYSRTTGKQRTSFNLVKACIEALEKTNKENKK